ncbi:MAG: biosynthetic peptidoglycan transglycosylase, partial [Bdellovibrio sp.]
MKIKRILFIALFLLLVGGISFFSWLWHLHGTLQEDLRTRKFLPPTQYYSAPTSWNLPFAASVLMMELRTRSYVEVPPNSPLLPGEYRQTSLSECPEWKADFQSGDSCLWVRAPNIPDPELEKRGVQKLWVRDNQVLAVQSAEGPETDLRLEPEILAQLIGAEALQQKLVALGQVPTFCLRAVLAAEDSRFLEHPGVSWLGMARALKVNLLGGKTRQGGSTITQQLVKNRFLNSERSFRRKWVEFWMSLLLEGLVSKDVILENYLNLIYMGQNGA